MSALGLATAVFGAPVPKDKPTQENYLHLPVSFERLGAGSEEVFVARGQGYQIGLAGGSATIGLPAAENGKGASIQLGLVGAHHPKGSPENPLPGKVNYLIGNDPTRWQVGLSTWGRVRYKDVYPGIDLVYYGNQKELEFDVVVRPGADLHSVRLKVNGASRLFADQNGGLRIGVGTGSESIAIGAPKLYQDTEKGRKKVAGSLALLGSNEIGLGAGPYDHAKSLVVDPTIVYSTLLGGSLGSSFSNAIAVDSSGNIVVAGTTNAEDFPLVNAAQPRNPNTNSFSPQNLGFVTKFNSSGTALIYSTYIGGSSGSSIQGLAIDAAGSAWVTGSTYSADFPLLNPAQASITGYEDAFVAKFSSVGALQFSTFLGGSYYNSGSAIAVDPSGSAYVTGAAGISFPTTVGAVNNTSSYGHGFVTKFSSSGSVLYSTVLGGNGSDTAAAIAADASGNAYVTGSTTSSVFVGSPGGGAQPANGGAGDAFVAKLNATGSGLIYFTFLGGSGPDSGTAIAVDNSGNAYVAGQTASNGLATAGAAQISLAGGTDGFIAKLDNSGNGFTWFTYLGGNRADSLKAMCLDPSGGVYVGGTTYSYFPLLSALQPAASGNQESLLLTSNSGSAWSAADTTLPGVAYDLSIDPTNTSVLLAATDAGIFRSANGGVTWTQQSTITNFRTGSVFSRSPLNPNTVYAAEGGYSAVVLSSYDDGLTWNVAGTPGSFYILGIVADPLSATGVYAFSTAGVYRSTDGGVTWTTASIGLPSSYPSSMVAASDGTLYALFGNGPYKSTNQGTSWSAFTVGIPPSYNTGPHSLAVSGTTVYFADGYNGIYKTTTSASFWTALSGSGLGYAYEIFVSPQNSSVLFALNNSIQVSTDGGSTWAPAGTGLPSTFSSSNADVIPDPANVGRAFAVGPVVQEAFVAKFNSTGSAMSWSTYLGSGSTQVLALASATAGTVYVTGNTYSGGFPITSTLLSSLPGYRIHVFVTGITDATSACSYTLTPGNSVIPYYGASITYSVVAPSGCSWTASSDQSWATVSSPASGVGVGTFTVSFGYDFSSGSVSRSVDLSVGTQSVTITQAGNSCGFFTDNSSYPVPPGGGVVTVNLNTFAGCPWSITNVSPGALTFNPASGTGPASVNVTVTPNPGTSARNFSLSVGNTSFQITQTSFTSGPYQFSPMTPCRLVDTRAANGPLGGPYLAGGAQRTFPVSGACNIPSGVAAYSLNVTAVPRRGTLGYLTVWPSGQILPGVSTLNSYDGSVLANAAIIPAGSSGSINAYATDDIDLIIDINGTFGGSQSGTLQFYPLTPCRVVDTRSQALTFGGPAIGGGTFRNFPVPQSSCGAPFNASAYSLNVTVAPHGALGYISIWPAGQQQPVVSTLNSNDGSVLANAAIVPAGSPLGAISIFASQTTDVIVDINGYFAAPGTGGQNYYTVAPCRLADTRGAAGMFGGPIMSAGSTRSFTPPLGACSLPTGAGAIEAYVLNMTVAPTQSLGYLTTWPAGQSQPVVSTLNDPKGLPLANMAVVPGGMSEAISAYVTNTTNLIIDVNGYFGQ